MLFQVSSPPPPRARLSGSRATAQVLPEEVWPLEMSQDEIAATRSRLHAMTAGLGFPA